MNLKLVVASMSLLGLISCPVFAATTTQAKVKHHTTTKVMKKHHYVKHHYVPHHTVVYPDYKDMGIPAPEICTISPTTIIMDQMTQNWGRSLPNPCNPDWFNRISLSGGINVDLGKWGNRNSGFQGTNYQRLSLNDAYLNISALVNEWVKAFASISYGDPTTFAENQDIGEYSAAYSNNIGGTGNNALQLEQAYATIANFEYSPLFLEVGKQFQDFSRYEIHPITRSMTQVMSETLATSAKLGFLTEGFHGSVFVFDDPIGKIGASHKTTNYGVAIGYDQPTDCNQFGWDFGVGYLYNLIGVNDTAYSVINFTNTRGYNSRVGGLAAYAGLIFGPFSLSATYTTALQRFNPLDLPLNGLADVAAGPDAVVIAGSTGAKPWTAGIQGGYGFENWGRLQNLYIGYQQSHQAAGLNLPKHRYLAGYNIDMWRNTNFGIEWNHDNEYSVSHGGRHGHSDDLVSLRAAVEFG